MSVPSGNPVRSKIRAAAVYGLQNNITTGGGYYNTVTRAYDPPRSYEDFDEFPCFNVESVGETCENAYDAFIGQQSQRLKNEFILKITAYVNDNNDPALAQDKILSDVQEYFGNNYTIPDSSGAGTAFGCYYYNSHPFGTEDNRPNVGIEINYLVWYRQFLTDPTQAG